MSDDRAPEIGIKISSFSTHGANSHLHEAEPEALVEMRGGVEIPGHGEGGLGQHLPVLADFLSLKVRKLKTRFFPTSHTIFFT